MVLLQTRYKIAAAAALGFLGLYLLQGEKLIELWSDRWCLVFENVEEKIEEIELQYGIDIKYDVGDNAIPELWKNPPSNGAATPITRYNLCRYFPVLSRELKKYPANIIRRDLSTIYLLSSLSFYGVQYGGTSIGNSIYLTGGARSEGYTDAYFASLLHHEMSSIFYRTYHFPKEAWSSINPENFFYAKTDNQVLKAIAKGDKLKNNTSLYREGFLSTYGYSTLENDFNLYTEMAFTHPQQLRSLVEKYSRVRQKADLMKSFYMKISEDFSLDY